MTPSLVILDPSSLLGKELVPILASAYPQLPRKYMHTRGVEEYLMLEVAEEAAVVAPLRDWDELAWAAAVIITDHPAPTLREPMASFFADRPQLPCLDLSPEPVLQAQVGVELSAENPQLRFPDPLLLLPVKILRAVAPLSPQRAFFSCLSPVSTRGEEALNELAAQAVARLSGERPKNRLLPSVLAFDAVIYPEKTPGNLEQQLQTLFPAVEVKLHPILAGIFHAHGLLATLELSTPTTLANLRGLLAREGFHFHKGSKPLSPSQGAAEGGIRVSVLRLSPREVSLWVVGDHLILQARAACEALGALLAPTPG